MKKISALVATVLFFAVLFLVSFDDKKNPRDTSADRPTSVGTSSSIVRLFTAGTSTYLVADGGRTLYFYEHGATSTSLCYEFCAAEWPPFVVAPGGVTDPALPGRFGTLYRTDGNIQMIYDGKPVYLYGGDSAAGDVRGEGRDKYWHAIMLR